jgi:hypothetical protein
MIQLFRLNDSLYEVHTKDNEVLFLADTLESALKHLHDRYKITSNIEVIDNRHRFSDSDINELLEDLCN